MLLGVINKYVAPLSNVLACFDLGGERLIVSPKAKRESVSRFSGTPGQMYVSA